MGVKTTIIDDRVGASDNASVLQIRGNVGANSHIVLTDNGAVNSALQLVGDFGDTYAQSLGNVYQQASASNSQLADKTLAALAKLTGDNTPGGQNKMFIYLALGVLVIVAYILTKRPK